MKHEIVLHLEKALKKAKKANDWPDFDMDSVVVDYAKEMQFGDYTSNVAMTLARDLKQSPMEIAEKIKENFDFEAIEKIEVARPGYLNFFLKKEFFQSLVDAILQMKGNFAQAKESGIKINNEFISANPTGPLHLGNGRGGFYGDVISRVLRKAGYSVTSEYYINNAGEQVVKLGHSVLKDEEAVYGGEYIDALHEKFGDKNEDVKTVGKKAAEEILEKYIKPTVTDKMHINFDKWTGEQEIVDEEYVKKALEILNEKGFAFEKDGAKWLRTSEFGDEKDRVLVKKDGVNTYFASDCGYILHKMERGFDEIIEVWGADHHGYIERFKAAAKALGFEGKVHFIIVQLAKLIKDGKEVRMSKRAGNVVYIDDLLEEIDHDVVRFFFLMYSPNRHMNFDLDLAREQSQKNPVFYVQYAHARIASILRKAQEQKLEIEKGDTSLLQHEKEYQVIRELMKLPELVQDVAKNREAHKLTFYTIGLADLFHSLYDNVRIIDEESVEMSQARLKLVFATKLVLKESLELLGVSAPEKM